MGVPQDQIEAAAAAERSERGDDGTVEIWPDNWPVVRLFIALETQWRVGIGMGVAVHLGIDYAAIEPAMRLLGVKRRDGLLDDLRLMERAALAVLNEG